MKHCILLAALLFSLPGTAAAQHIAEGVPSTPSALSVERASPAGPAFVSERASVAQAAPFSEVLIGTAIGASLGGLVGVGAGLLVYAVTERPDAEMFGALPQIAAGGALGMAAGSWMGARAANDRRGNPWATAAASVVGVAAGMGLGLLVGDATASTATGFMVAIPIAILLPALAERATSR
jgi:hypothetical protein